MTSSLTEYKFNQLEREQDKQALSIAEHDNLIREIDRNVKSIMKKLDKNGDNLKDHSKEMNVHMKKNRERFHDINTKLGFISCEQQLEAKEKKKKEAEDKEKKEAQIKAQAKKKKLIALSAVGGILFILFVIGLNDSTSDRVADLIAKIIGLLL